MTGKHDKQRRLLKMAGALGLVLVAALIIWLANRSEKPIQAKKVVQQVTIITPPPPPPPPPPQETPPPPEEPEKVDIPEPEQEPEPAPEESSEPPAGDLGVDADGGAGGDAFGLVGRKGGRGLLSGAGGDPLVWYGKKVTKTIRDAMDADDVLAESSDSFTVELWINEAGRIERMIVVSGKGDDDLAARVRQILTRIGSFSDRPPEGLPQPVKLRINQSG